VEIQTITLVPMVSTKARRSGEAPVDPVFSAAGCRGALRAEVQTSAVAVVLAGLVNLNAVACSSHGSEEGLFAGSGAGGSSGGGAREGTDGSAGQGGSAPDVDDLPRFSFFVSSYDAMERLSGSQDGFGGDLRYGQANGLAGADTICAEIAEFSMPGSSRKRWRAFLSIVSGGPSGGPVHAIDRVGAGPWYDRLGRLVAQGAADLQNVRPVSADPAILNDLPNEFGVPNHAPDGVEIDNHHILTGSNAQGRLYEKDPRVTCQDWSSSVGSEGEPRVGLSWTRPSTVQLDLAMAAATHWISSQTEAGCASGTNFVPGDPTPDVAESVGAHGGYGGIYCFAATP
jgi:hypothetical protein